jgi:hypothetical protein
MASVSLDSPLQSQFAMLRKELLQLVVDHIEEVSRPLREEVATIKLLLARVASSLDRTDLCSSKRELSVVVDVDAGDEMTSEAADVAILCETLEETSVVGDDSSFGCFSHRARTFPSHVPVASKCKGIDGIMVPVMKIMPELQELCGEPSSPTSMVQTSAVASTPHPVMLSHHDEKVIEACALDPNSEALFARELCDLLASLEVAIPGSRKEIACLLAEQTSRDKIQKVKDYLRIKSKKSGATRRKSVA